MVSFFFLHECMNGFLVQYYILRITTGPGSKLTMSLVNDSLKFQMALLQIHFFFFFFFFFLKKYENPLQCKG